MADVNREEFLRAGRLTRGSMEPKNLAALDKLSGMLSDYLRETGRNVDDLSVEEFQTFLELVPEARQATLDYWEGISRFMEVSGSDFFKKK